MSYTLFGLPIFGGGTDQALESIQRLLQAPGHHLVVTANPEILTYAKRHRWYLGILRHASLIMPDGIGVVFASWLSSTPLRGGRVTGIRLTIELARLAKNHGYSMLIVGASEAILQNATQEISLLTGNTDVYRAVGPQFSTDEKFPLDSQPNRELIELITKIRPQILLIGFGHPKQEKWLDHYLPVLPVSVGIGVGGTFDTLAGVAGQAPKVLRSLGLEWLWRLVWQPWRLWRILNAVVVFPYLVIVDRVERLFHVEHADN